MLNTGSHALAKNAALRSALGPYRLLGEIGRGATGTVSLAVFSNGNGTGRPVALKQLHPELALDREFRAMFEDEARVATRLHHDNVVETYDVLSDPELCVLVMEFLEGQTLLRVRQTASRMGSLPLAIQLHCLAQVLAGLDYVHELTDERGNPLQIVRRDFTPTNVLVTYRGEVKVVDFGIAKTSTRLVETRVGMLKDKLVYMSPEAVRGEPVDRRSDIFSVGVMLWEAVTGRRLWKDQDDLGVFRQLASGLVPLRLPGVAISDPAAFAIAERALASDPDHRYATAAAMRRDIEDLLARRGTVLGSGPLAGYMQSCFAEERQRLQTVLDEALASFQKPAAQPPSPPPYVAAGAPALDAHEPPTTVSIPQAPIFRTATYPGLFVSQPARRELPWLGMVAAACVVALAVGVAFFAHAPRAAQAKPAGVPFTSATVATTASAAAPPAAVVVAAAEAPRTIDADLEVAPGGVTVVFSARPPEARLFLDGERLEGNPVTLRRQPDAKRHRLRIEAPGFIPFSRSFYLDEDMTRVFDLVRKPPPAARTPQAVEPTDPTKPACPKSLQALQDSDSPATTR